MIVAVALFAVFVIGITATVVVATRAENLRSIKRQLKAELKAIRRRLLALKLRCWGLRFSRWRLAVLIFTLKLPDHWPWLSRTIDPLFKRWI